MNFLKLSSVLSIVCVSVVLAEVNQPRRLPKMITRSLEYPLRQTLHRKRSTCLDTEVQCPPAAGQPPQTFGYLENCLKAAEGLVAEDNHVPEFGCGNCFLFVNLNSTQETSVYSSSMTPDLLKEFLGQVLGSGILGCSLSSGPREKPKTSYPDGDNDLYIYFSTKIPINSTECGRPDKHLKPGE